MSARAPWMTLPLWLALSCLRPSEERALADQMVGVASGEGLHVTVSEGLAAVHRIRPGGLELWAQAPALDLHLTFDRDAADTWAVSVDNCPPDATLRATAGSASLEVSALPRPRPTACRWSLARADAREALLTLRTPPIGPGERWRFAVISDVQGHFELGQRAYLRMNLDPTIRFVVSAGDFTESGSVDELRRLQESLRVLRVPLYGTPGNHDMLDLPSTFASTFGRSSFRFVHDGVQFTFVDSSAGTIDPLVMGHLRAWLSEGRDRVHVVVTHVPPMDPVGERNLGFASRDEAARLLSLLARGGVDLTLYGHVHSYYAFTNAGIPAYISGGGGGAPEELVGVGPHYLTVDLDAAGVRAVTRVDVP